MRRLLLALLTGLPTTLPAATDAGIENPPLLLATPSDATSSETSLTRNGRDIFSSFLAGRADPGCDSDQSSPRWEQHFSRAPTRLAADDQDVLPLFGYVVDELRQAGLPTEFALIPFVESGYHPAARNGNGPAGMWQFIASTARNHQVAVSGQYDGRLSAVDSTSAAVRYLKTLYGMFGGDWRLAMMAYNAGEYRVLQSMRRAGMNASNAEPSKLPGLSQVTYQYVEKLHALSCVLDRAQTHGGLLTALDRPVPVLVEHALPAGISLANWAGQKALAPEMVARLNPALSKSQPSAIRNVLAPAVEGEPVPDAALAAFQVRPRPAEPNTALSDASRVASADKRTSKPGRTHTVRDGESAWTIAKRYGITVGALLSNNGLTKRSVLKPGMVLAFEDRP